jgi:hypothetical protein
MRVMSDSVFDDELPLAVEESIASWRRTIAGALPENAADILCNAAADLFATRKVNKTTYPDSDGIVNQAIVDGLHDMAVIAEIDDDDAQLIFAEAQSRVDKPDTRTGMNGHGARDRSFAWPTIDAAAYHGLVGDIVRTITPHTEADPIALLIQTLAMAGNVIGRLPHYRVESDNHRTNLFAVLVGDSAKGRKGVSLSRVRSFVKIADEIWCRDRIKSGLSSGEGFIHEVRDPVQKYDAKEKRLEIVDPGTTDKRLMIVEPEFAGALSAAERHGNTLSPNIRKAFDGDKLQSMTRNSPLMATDAHVSIIGHVTIDELRARISRTDLANGFANRFLFTLIRRSKELPFGGDLTDSEILHLGEQLKSVIDKAKPVGRVTMTDNARAKWAAIYHDLSAARPGLLGAVIARAEALTVRLSLIYALLDGCNQIDLPHLDAALAVWEYCELSAVHIFGGAIGDPIADDIARALAANSDGLTRTDIYSFFGRHQSRDRIAAALQLLAANGLAHSETRETGGRPVEIWFASQQSRPTDCALSALSAKRGVTAPAWKSGGGLNALSALNAHPPRTGATLRPAHTFTTRPLSQTPSRRP